MVSSGFIKIPKASQRKQTILVIFWRRDSAASISGRGFLISRSMVAKFQFIVVKNLWTEILLPLNIIIIAPRVRRSLNLFHSSSRSFCAIYINTYFDLDCKDITKAESNNCFIWFIKSVLRSLLPLQCDWFLAVRFDYSQIRLSLALNCIFFSANENRTVKQNNQSAADFRAFFN